MIFLIEYDRDSGRIVTMKSFDDEDREKAEESRLKLELDLNARGVESEVVLLEAANEEAVRRTHRRYFEDLHELASPSPSR
ncbi:MAG TPA: hypothetical protein VHE60_00155 [Pyrinomonadaceae bacterium]|nr:hypothetical protein [Pyrinomonadaceae bacterium]